MQDVRAGRPAGWSSRQIQNAARHTAHDTAAGPEKAARRATRHTRAIPPLIFRAIRQAHAVSLKASFHINTRARAQSKSARSPDRPFRVRRLTQPLLLRETLSIVNPITLPEHILNCSSASPNLNSGTIPIVGVCTLKPTALCALWRIPKLHGTEPREY